MLSARMGPADAATREWRTLMEIGSIGRTVVVVSVGAALLAGCGGKDNTSAAPQTASAAPAATVSAVPASAAPDDNGVAALTPAQIVDRAKAALKSAKSFHMNGTLNEDGQKTALDFKIAGADVSGTMTVNNAKVKLLRVGSNQYMNPDAAFWKLSGGKQAAAINQLVNGRWVKVPATNKDFGALFSAADVDSLLQASGTVTKGSTKVIAGTPAIGLIDKGSDGGTLYVATVGQPYPLRLDGPTAAAGSITFSEFGTAFTDIKAPAATDVVDLSKLGG
jgi:hypothetical protein